VEAEVSQESAEAAERGARSILRPASAPPPTPHATVQKRAKDTMTEFAALFASIAAAYQPIEKDENGWPIFRDNGHRENFLAFAQKAMVYSQWAAPYQDPNLSSDRRRLRAERCLCARAVA
jgi:hypothetical protein